MEESATFQALRAFRQNLSAIQETHFDDTDNHAVAVEAIGYVLEATDMANKMECDHDNCCWYHFTIIIMQQVVPLLRPDMFTYHKRMWEAFDTAHSAMKDAYLTAGIDSILGDNGE